MSTEKNHINYSAADIEKYWKGQLSAAEQHAMEKSALEDPFLADAMEGYEEKALAPQPVIIPDNDELKKRLAERIAKKEEVAVIKFPWWKVAAVLIVFAGAGWIYISVNNKAKNQSVAKNDEIKKETPVIAKEDTVPITTGIPAITDTLHDVAVNKLHSVPEKATSLKEKHREAATENDNAPVVSAKAPVPAHRQAATARQADTTNEKNDEVAKLTDKKKTADKSVTSDLPEQRVQGISTDEYKANDVASPGRAANTPNIFNGNITDQANKPVANASIQIPNLNVATQTDKKGYFSFKAQDTVLSVSIASVGFETQNFHLRNKATLNQIILKPAQNNLGEAVVVQSNGAERKKESTAQSKDISIKILDAEPVIGWTAYNDYLQKNKKTTDDTKNIHGNVVVSFEVHSKLVNNFRIEQSLDEDLDAEAIRLIKEGPAWKLLRGKKATVTVTVRF